MLDIRVIHPSWSRSETRSVKKVVDFIEIASECRTGVKSSVRPTRTRVEAATADRDRIIKKLARNQNTVESKCAI